MARFSAIKMPFGLAQPKDKEGDDGEGLPNPKLVKLAARRTLGLKEAQACIEHLPGPGESLHAVVTARLDLTDLIAALLLKLGSCDRMVIATLGFNHKNLQAMAGWLDSGAVLTLTLLSSLFHRAHKGALWTETVEAFHDRGQRLAACHSHAKVASMAFSNGQKFSIEGSANLCGNGSGREQFALINDPGLADWHAQWIEELVSRHEAVE